MDIHERGRNFVHTFFGKFSKRISLEQFYRNERVVLSLRKHNIMDTGTYSYA